MRMIELHGGDINKDEHILSKVGQLGVDHFALGSLYSYLKKSGKLDENADFLVREILRLEAESLSATEPKFQERGFIIKCLIVPPIQFFKKSDLM